MSAEEELPELEVPVNGVMAESMYLRREKEEMPSLAAQKHPHGHIPASSTHPHHQHPRVKTYGNDNSSVNRQTRSQVKPDPVPGRWSREIFTRAWTLIITLRPRQNGRHFADDIFNCIFLNENAGILLKISLKFFPKVQINNIPALVQMMA